MKESISPKIILGLGNPGKEYENTYHNVGLLAIEFIAEKTTKSEKAGWKNYKGLFEYRKKESEMNNQELVIVKPLVFMNESGIAAKEVLKKFNITPKDLIIFHDDSDLSLGKFKITNGQSSAGHKGVQSIIDHLGTNEFQRVKIGIREIENGKQETGSKKRKKAEEFVLSQIKQKDKEILEKIYEEIKKELF